MGLTTFNYDNIKNQYPWILEHDRNCVISPDVDGMLSGLLLSKFLNWKIAGFYNGNMLLIKNDIKPKDVVYLDVEIYNKNVFSVGQHMLLPNKEKLPETWNEFENCISANNLRNFDAKNDFPNKYPLGTIHLLLFILEHNLDISCDKKAVAPLLYADGTFKTIFSYPENALEWFKFFDLENSKILRNIFSEERQSLMETMNLMKSLFAGIREISGGTRGGEKIKIKHQNGKLTNINTVGNDSFISEEEVKKTKKILKMLGEMTGWEYKSDAWHFDKFNIHKLEKGILSDTISFNSRNKLLNGNPISFAITATNRVEYTKFKKGVFD